jgi:hypothetical protein
MDFRAVSARLKVAGGVGDACRRTGVSSSAWYLYCQGKRTPPAKVIGALVRESVVSREEGADLMRTYHPDVAAML